MEGVFLKSKGEKRPLTPLKARCLELSLELGALVVLKKLVSCCVQGQANQLMVSLSGNQGCALYCYLCRTY